MSMMDFRIEFLLRTSGEAGVWRVFHRPSNTMLGHVWCEGARNDVWVAESSFGSSPYRPKIAGIDNRRRACRLLLAIAVDYGTVERQAA